ncbi:MAG: hypothetical protein OEZ39_00040 [Gammaproteobacteria bacterium]|nr:hypothetical protein [Gammaproteobacteria bacterium]
MTRDTDTLREQEQQLWTLIAAKADEDDISDLFREITREHEDRMHSDYRDLQSRHDYCEFALQFLRKYPAYDRYSIEWEIQEIWSDFADKAEFTPELESLLFAAIRDNTLTDTPRVEQIAADFYKNKNLDKARAYYDLVRDKLTDEKSWWQLAECYAAIDDLQTAESILYKGTFQHPDSFLLACNRGFYLYRLGQIDAALLTLDGVIHYAEQKKYTSDYYYIYALDLKMTIYNNQGMYMNALLEKSRLSSAGKSSI